MTASGDLTDSHQDEPHSGKEDDASVERLIQQIDRYLRLLRVTHEAIVCVDEHCHIVTFNQGAEKLFGYAPGDILGKRLSTLICKRYRAEEKSRLAALTRIARDNRLSFHTSQVVGRNKNGERIPCEVSLSQNVLLGHRLYTLIIRDMTQRLQHESQLTYRAQHDQLTDLPNRILLGDRLTAGIARASRYHRRLGVVYLDLDNFKPINDRYGHETGDCLLQAVARRLQDTVRHSDTVCRMGGDEFIICVEHINSPRDAVAAADKILDALKPPFQILGHHITTEASIGIAVYPDHGRDANTLLRNADHAMYQAKSSTSGPCLFQPGPGSH